MRERDYAIATNVVRIRLMQTLLREMNSERYAGGPENEAKEVAVILRRWEERCENVLTPQASRKRAP